MFQTNELNIYWETRGLGDEVMI